MNHGDIKLVIDQLRKHTTRRELMVADMLETLGNQVAAQSAVIEKLSGTLKLLSYSDDKAVRDIAYKALSIPTDSTQILQEWLTSQINLNGYSYSINDTYVLFSVDEPPDDAYDEGSLVPLYAIKKPEILK